MKLYYMPGACSLASHILLLEAGAKFTTEKVGRDKKTESGVDYLSVTPKGYVPALKLNDGYPLTENVVIHQYIADTHPDAKLLPKHGTKERLKLEELMVYISTEIHKGYSPLFSPTMPDAAKSAMKEKLHQRYQLIETLLSDNRTWLDGETYTTPDAYLFTVTRWAKPTNVELSAFPHVLAHSKRVAERPAVQAALKAEGLA